MPIASMTGFGRAQAELGGWTVSSELRAVNHRGLDARVSVPPAVAELEAEVREQVKTGFARGRIELRVSLDAPGAGRSAADELERARREYERLEAMRHHLGLAEPVRLETVLAALAAPTGGDPTPPEGIAETVRDVVSRGLESLRESRLAEGAALRDEFLGRLATARSLVAEIDASSASHAESHRERVRGRLDELLAKLEAGPVDEPRLLQEVAIQLDKADITEEIVRARTHAEALVALFEADNPDGRAVGKRVDFTLQELGREANTMASKSASAELTEVVVRLKTEIERMREQAQNLE